MTWRSLMATVALALAACGEPCVDNPHTEDVQCDGEPCGPLDGETGGAVCTPHVEPTFDGQTMSCGPNTSTAEHCIQDAVLAYGLTDYAWDTPNATLALKFDFEPIPQEDWFEWDGNRATAVPGVATHEGKGDTWAAYMSRGCCAQWVVDGHLDAPPPDPTCGSAYSHNPTPEAWCLPMLDGSGAGLCVYPCAEANDCPNPAGEFCDLSRPDPAGYAPGVCRYKSMPLIPTPLEEINGQP